MSQSYVETVTKQEKRFIGSTPIFDSGISQIDYPNIFLFNISISSQIPLPETSTFYLTITGEPGSDANGIVYSGQFRIRRNIIGIPSIIVTGRNLTSSQIEIIKNSMSVIENVSSNGLDSLTNVTFSLTPIARAGVASFDVTIPYDDENVTLPNNDVVIPFLAFDAINRNSSFINPIIVIVENNEITINAGSIERESPVIILSRNYSLARNITSMSINFAGSAFQNHISLMYQENLQLPQNQEGIRFIPTGLMSLPSRDSSGFSTTANYNVRVETNFWKNRQVSLPSNVWREDGSNPYARLAYKIQYGICKIENDQIVDEKMFTLGVYAGTSASINLQANQITFTINDQGSTNISRKPFSLVNRHNRPFNRIYLNIDRNNNSNNIFIVDGFLNSIPAIMTYSGFSNTMTIEEFINNVQEILRTQYSEWHNNGSPIRGLVFTIDNRYKHGNVGDLTSFEIQNVLPNQNLSNTFFIVPQNVGITSVYVLEFFNLATSLSLSFQEFFDTIKHNLGSFGMSFLWNIPNVPEWRNLKLNPVVTSRVINQTVYSGGVLTPFDFFSSAECFFQTYFDSSKGQENNTIGGIPLRDLPYAITILPGIQTLSDIASYLTSRFSTIMPQLYPNNPSFMEFPPAIGITCLVPNDYYSEIGFNNIHISFPGSDIFFFLTLNPTISSFTRYQTPESIPSSISVGNTLSGGFSKIKLLGNFSEQLTIPLDNLGSLGSLVDVINNPSSRFKQFIRANLVDDFFASNPQQNINPINFYNMVSNPDLYISSRIDSPIIRRYPFSTYTTLRSISEAIINDTTWLSSINVQIDSSTTFHSDAVSSNLIQGVSSDITRNPLPKFFNGEVSSILIPSIQTANVILHLDISFANTGGVGITPTTSSGVQVALGGYEKNGVFFVNRAPNAFYEPVYNSIFPISFTTIDADVVYLLIRSRLGLTDPSYISIVENYSGMARYSNGYSPYSFVPYIATESRFTSNWDEGDPLGIPVVVAVPSYSTSIDVTIEDNSISESINLTIINKPSEIDQIGFLAVNRTNNNRSQTESRVARVFGLVLDNRGAWDVLMSPEASLVFDSSGSLSHLDSLYKRNIFNDDEGFDFELTTSLPSEIKNSISVTPMANNPQVWILRIEHGVKKYLGQLIAQNNDEESLVGCSIDLDFLITGRTTGVKGTARVTIYYDYTCVYDIGLCDYFWNLIDPPKPAGPEIIQNLIDFSYQTLVDCNNLITQINDNIEINAPILISVNNIPTFKNGNALLLIKSSYTPEIQGFYYPTGNLIDSIQFPDCSAINLNIPLMQRLNKEFLILPNQENPINDISQIRSLLSTANSYLWVKPQFQFPPNDSVKDCNNNEIVVIGIGYVFKNWRNGTRKDDVLIGANLLFSQGVFTSPEMNICYHYYYNQKET